MNSYRFEQACLAGILARKILVDGVTPGSIPMQVSNKGQPMINLVRAKDLALPTNVGVLLNVKTTTDCSWDR